MRVGVQREACRKMPQHTRYGFDVHSVLQGQRCEGVAQVMETHLRATLPAFRTRCSMCNTLSGDMGPPVGDGNTHSLLPVFAFLCCIRTSDRVCRQRQCAVGVFRFQRHLN